MTMAMLVAQQREARFELLRGALALVSVIVVILTIAWSTASAYVILATVLATRWLARGITNHAIASYRLRQLENRRSNLPTARVVD
jgi:hypothetical protein